MACPRCKAKLATVRTIALGPDDFSDDYTFKTFACEGCALVGVGYYEESRRGSGESWHHRGYETSREDHDRVNREIATCPAPSNPRCGCEAHQRYGASRDGTHAAIGLVSRIGDMIDLG